MARKAKAALGDALPGEWTGLSDAILALVSEDNFTAAELCMETGAPERAVHNALVNLLKRGAGIAKIGTRKYCAVYGRLVHTAPKNPRYNPPFKPLTGQVHAAIIAQQNLCLMVRRG